MYSAALTSALLPKMVRLPRYLPLSRLMGASPARAAIFFLLSCPSSGSLARSVQALTGPIPLNVLKRFSFSLHRGVFLITPLMSLPVLSIHVASHSMWASLSGFVQDGAIKRRFFSSVSIWTSCLLRATRACNLWASAFLRGRITSPNRAMISASIASVLDSFPRALAKSRICLGLTTTTLRLPEYTHFNKRNLVSSRGFQRHERKLQRGKKTGDTYSPLLIIGKTLPDVIRSYEDFEGVLCYVDPSKLFHQCSSLRDAGSRCGPGSCSSLYGERCDDPRSRTRSYVSRGSRSATPFCNREQV